MSENRLIGILAMVGFPVAYVISLNLVCHERLERFMGREDKFNGLAFEITMMNLMRVLP